MGKLIDKFGYKSGQSLAFREIRDMNAAWRSVLFLAQHRKYAKGEFVQPGKKLLFLERGRMRLMHQSVNGEEKILWYIREGCIFGETALFDPSLIDYYCICMTACSVYAFSLDDLEKISREKPDLVFNLLHTQARKLRMLAYQTSSLSQDSLLVRICKFLSQQLVPDSEPLCAKITISQQEMANLLGVHRVSLYRELRQQEEQGLFGSLRGDVLPILRPGEFYRLAGIVPN